MEMTYGLSTLGAIGSLEGTLQFDWALNDPAFNGSPNSRFAMVVKAVEVAPIPLPAAAPLMLLGMGALAAAGVARRRRRA